MTEKINLRPLEYAIFRTIANSPERKIPYKKLRDMIELKPTSFASYISILASVGIVSKSGPFRNQTIHATKLLSEVQVAPITRNKVVSSSKPKSNKYTGQGKKRKCLKCRTEFKSEWSGERICGACKVSRAWTDDSPYTPSGDGDGFGVSDLVTGVI